MPGKQRFQGHFDIFRKERCSPRHLARPPGIEICVNWEKPRKAGFPEKGNKLRLALARPDAGGDSGVEYLQAPAGTGRLAATERDILLVPSRSQP